MTLNIQKVHRWLTRIGSRLW